MYQHCPARLVKTPEKMEFRGETQTQVLLQWLENSIKWKDCSNFDGNIFTQLINRADFFYSTNFDINSNFLEHRFTDAHLCRLSETIKNLLNTAEDLVNKQEMVQIFDRNLIQSSLNYHVSIFDAVMCSKLTENYLKFKLADKNKYSRSIFWNIILPIFYPIMMVLSICSDKLRTIYSIYPHSAFLEWIGNMWMVGILMCLQFLDEKFKILFFGILLIFTLDLVFAESLIFIKCFRNDISLFKSCESQEKTLSLYDIVFKCSKCKIQLNRALSFYLSDRWNYINFVQSISMVVFLIFYITLPENSSQSSFLYQTTQIAWIITTVSSFIRILKIFELTKNMGDTIEAILAILVNAVRILILISVIWVGFLAAGWAVLKTETTYQNKTIMEFAGILLRALLGLIDINSELVFTRFCVTFFWASYFCVIVIVTLNGLVSIMTFSLDSDMSACRSRYRKNLFRYNGLKIQDKKSQWPIPFKILGFSIGMLKSRNNCRYRIETMEFENFYLDKQIVKISRRIVIKFLLENAEIDFIKTESGNSLMELLAKNSELCDDEKTKKNIREFLSSNDWNGLYKFQKDFADFEVDEVECKKVNGNYTCTIMHLIFKNFNENLLQVCLNKETVDSCPKDSYGYFPMELVFKKKDCNKRAMFLKQMIGIFYERGIDLNKQNEYGWSMLHYAAKFNFEVKFSDSFTSKQLATSLFEKSAKLELRTNDGDTPFLIACKFNNDKFVNDLSKNEFVFKKCMKMRNDLNYGPGLIASRYGHNPVLEVLYNNEKDMLFSEFIKCEATGQEVHLLTMACLFGNLETAKYLLKRDAKWNVSDQNPDLRNMIETAVCYLSLLKDAGSLNPFDVLKKRGGMCPVYFQKCIDYQRNRELPCLLENIVFNNFLDEKALKLILEFLSVINYGGLRERCILGLFKIVDGAEFLKDTDVSSWNFIRRISNFSEFRFKKLREAPIRYQET